ncbi:MAG: hypothetical protein AAGJ35_05475, partial [Myxococcota bacterium]
MKTKSWAWLSLFLCLLIPVSGFAQYDPDLDDGPPPSTQPPVGNQGIEQPGVQETLTNPDQVQARPYITVNGVQVYYYYTPAGAIRYYYFNDEGLRFYYPVGWRPWYINGGNRVFFRPTPYVLFGGRPVYYYWYNGRYRYYWYNNGAISYYPVGWRPWYMRGGNRVFYRPFYRYRYRRWFRHRRWVRRHTFYRPRLYRTRYRRFYRRYRV